MTRDGIVNPGSVGPIATPCVRCAGPIQNERHAPCCSSHKKMLCCKCYSVTHFVDTGCCGPEFARVAS